MSLTTAFAGYALFLTSVIVALFCVKAIRIAFDLSKFFTPFYIGAFAFACLAGGIYAISNTGVIKRNSVQADRLSELCKGATIDVRQIASGVTNLYVNEDYAPSYVRFSPGYMLQGSSLGYGLLTSGKIQFLERLELNRNGLGQNLVRLRLENKEGKTSREFVDSITADYAVIQKSLVSEQDKSLNLTGAEVRVENRRTGELLSRFTYFGMTELPYKHCPSFEGNLLPIEIVYYVLGLGSENDRILLKNRLNP